MTPQDALPVPGNCRSALKGLNNRTSDFHYHWTKKWGAGQPHGGGHPSRTSSPTPPLPSWRWLSSLPPPLLPLPGSGLLLPGSGRICGRSCWYHKNPARGPSPSGDGGIAVSGVDRNPEFRYTRTCSLKTRGCGLRAESPCSRKTLKEHRTVPQKVCRSSMSGLRCGSHDAGDDKCTEQVQKRLSTLK